MMSFDIDMDVSDASAITRRPPAELPLYEPTSPTARGALSNTDKVRVMAVSVIEGPSRRFILKKTLLVALEHTAQGVFARHAFLPISGHGENIRDAFAEFCEMFEMQWESLVDGALDELTKSAFQVRKDLMALADPAKD